MANFIAKKLIAKNFISKYFLPKTLLQKTCLPKTSFPNIFCQKLYCQQLYCRKLNFQIFCCQKLYCEKVTIISIDCSACVCCLGKVFSSCKAAVVDGTIISPLPDFNHSLRHELCQPKRGEKISAMRRKEERKISTMSAQFSSFFLSNVPKFGSSD